MFNIRLSCIEKKISTHVSKIVENAQTKGNRETMVDIYT